MNSQQLCFCDSYICCIIHYLAYLVELGRPTFEISDNYYTKIKLSACAPYLSVCGNIASKNLNTSSVINAQLLTLMWIYCMQGGPEKVVFLFTIFIQPFKQK